MQQYWILGYLDNSRHVTKIKHSIKHILWKNYWQCKMWKRNLIILTNAQQHANDLKRKTFFIFLPIRRFCILDTAKLERHGVEYSLLLIIRDLSADNSGEWLWCRSYHTVLECLGDCRNAIKARHHILGIWSEQPHSTMPATFPVQLKLLLWDLRFSRKWQANLLPSAIWHRVFPPTFQPILWPRPLIWTENFNFIKFCRKISILCSPNCYCEIQPHSPN